jgi:hypothetical protein
MAAIDSHPTITEEEYVGKLRSWSESTSTSPSGMHLGHYRALIARHAYSDVDSDVPEENAKRAEWNHKKGMLAVSPSPIVELCTGERIRIFTMAHSG